MERGKIKKTAVAYLAARLFATPIAMMMGVYALRLKSSGLNFLEINLVNACFMILVFLFEVPTGSFADVFGHKKSFVAGLALEGAGLAVYFFARSFWGFVAAEIILAFAASLQSGSLNAWAVNNFRRYGWTAGYTRFFGWTYIFERLAIGLLVVVGAKIGHWFGLDWPFLVAALLVFAGAGLTWLLLSNGDNPEAGAGRYSWHDFCVNIVRGRKIIIDNKGLMALFGGSFLVAMTIQPLNMQWPILYVSRFATTDVSLPSFLLVLGTIAGAALIVKFCQGVKSMVGQLLLLTSFIGLTIAVIPEIKSRALFLAVFFAHEIPRGMLKPIQESWLGELVQDDARRATVSSYFGMFWTLAAGIGLLASGFWSEWLGISLCWQVTSIVTLVTAFVFFVLSQKQKPL